MVRLRFYDALTREKIPFVPVHNDHVRMYVCGPTVYDRAHIGNMRPVVVFDVLFRLLTHIYPKVTYVANITDIDDKIIDAALKSQCTIDEITNRAISWYQEDCTALGAKIPTITPRATDHIDEMIQMIVRLIDGGYAYVSKEHVLFNIKKYKGYGALANRKLDEMISGARIEVDDYKRNAGDFVLWKPSRRDMPGWASPWGYGRPGWHIECSAMAQHYLGDVFDIHGGGIDLLFPHHENERAQSCCANQSESFAKYWLHNGHVTINGDKMSKSTGNFFTVADKSQEYSWIVMRYLMLSTHYRQPLDWRDDLAMQAKQSLNRLYMSLKDVDDNFWYADLAPSNTVVDALGDDLNTPKALQLCHDLASAINKAYGVEKQKMQRKLLGAGHILGIFPDPASHWFQGAQSGIEPQEIEALIEKRVVAKHNNDYVEADAVRSQLEEHGIVLEDGRKGTTWRFR